MNVLTQQLSTLKLSGIKVILQQQFEQASLYLEQSVEERLTTQAKFRLKANLQELDHSVRCQLSKDKIRYLAQ